MNNSNTANLEFWSRCCILRAWRVGVYDLACWGMRPSVLGGNLHEQRNLQIQGRMQIFEKMSQKALNRVLVLDSSGGNHALQSPLKIMGLQNKNISVVTKH